MSEFTAAVTAKAAVYRLFRSSLCGDGESLSVGQVAEVKGHVQLAVYQLHVSRDDDMVQINVIQIQKKIELWSVNNLFFTMFSLIHSPAAPHHRGNLIHVVLMSESSESLVCPTDL